MIVVLRETVVLLVSKVVGDHRVSRAELGDLDLRAHKDKGDSR